MNTCFRSGHAGIALRLSRIQAPLDSEKCLELGHHILKAHIYRNMTLHKVFPRDLQAFWVCSSAENASAALGSLRNIYNPNVKVRIMYSLKLYNYNIRALIFIPLLSAITGI